jgi:hypothetical protein
VGLAQPTNPLDMTVTVAACPLGARPTRAFVTKWMKMNGGLARGVIEARVSKYELVFHRRQLMTFVACPGPMPYLT